MKARKISYNKDVLLDNVKYHQILNKLTQCLGQTVVLKVWHELLLHVE